MNGIDINEYPPVNVANTKPKATRRKKRSRVVATILSVNWLDNTIDVDVNGSTLTIPFGKSNFPFVGRKIEMLYEGTLGKSTFNAIGIE